MAASIMAFTRVNFYQKIHSNLQLVSLALRQCPQRTYSRDIVEAEDIEIDVDEEINRLRDVSNLSFQNKQKMSGLYFDMEEIRSTEKYSRTKLRKMYALYGMASGIDPSIIWPSEGEMDNMIEIDKYWTCSFHQLEDKLSVRKRKENKKQLKKEKRIHRAMAEMPKMIEKFKEQQKKKKVKRDHTKVNQDDIRDEFVEYFGYEPVPDTKYELFKNYKKFEKAQEQKKVKKGKNKPAPASKGEAQKVEGTKEE